MNNMISLLQQLERQGVKLALNDKGQLISQSSKEAVTPAIGATIKTHKDELVRCLAARAAFEAPIEVQGALSGPLSSSQSGLWFIEQYEEASHLYNMPVYFRVSGELDTAALEFAFDHLFARHPSMRTRFIKDEAGRGAQEILPHVPFKLQIEDVSEQPAAEREAYVARRVREEIGRPFSLTQGDLSRVHLIRLGSREHVLLITQHHIISDGWSVKNMFADLKRAFLAHQNREPLQVSELPLTYLDYARWFNSPRFLDYHAEFKPFWVDRLGGSPEVHGLPLDKPRSAHQASGGELVFSTIDNALWESFKRLCQRHSTSNFIGLHALFALLMVRQSGEKEVVIGTPLAYRERHEIESLVGFFVNTLVLRTRLEGRPSFVDYLQQCREEDLAAFDHQLYRFEALAEAIGADRTTAINPIFQIMLVYQAKVDFNDLIPGCQLVEETSPVLPAKTDISVKVTELMDSVRVDWLFATALFERETIQSYADRLLYLMRAVVAAPETEIWQLPLEAGTDRAALAAELAELPRDYPSRDTLLCHIERRAGKLPDALAVSDGADALTYGELEARANRLAHWLLAQGVTPGAAIGIQAKRDVAFVIALLACWKAGAAYVPLDPAYPAERLAHILSDASIKLVLGGEQDARLAEALTGADAGYHNLHRLVLESLPCSVPAVSRDAAMLAQIIYTSGSTGLPKGVMVEQGSLVNLMADHGDRIALGKGGAMFNCMSLSFDAGNMTTLLPLYCGAALHFGEPGEGVISAAIACGASHMILPTALLANLLPAAELGSLKAIGFGGEACPSSLVERWGERVALFNMYGPTECTVTALCARLVPGQPITIGQPINNLKALILDEGGNLCPVGVPGELSLSGLGLARGYLNLPERTQEAFIELALDGRTHRLYRTGDRALLRRDGNIQYLGRLDEQIKLRGYRIEPGEIETQVAALCPAIRQIKVVVQEGRLLAYACLHAEASEPDGEALLQRAGECLPEYMVPARLCWLPEMPLTPNGKLDLRRLPAIDWQQSKGEPQSELEQTVLAIWQGVLKQPLGVEDDFFRLGGDSILSIQLTTRLRDAGLHCSVKDVFEAKTVRRLCRQLGQQQAVSHQTEQGNLTGEFPLHPIQHWFFEQGFAKPGHWNQGVILRLPAGVDDAALHGWLDTLRQHHDALRLAVTPTGQRYLAELALPPLPTLDAGALGGAELQARLTELQGDLDPASGHTLAWARLRNLSFEGERETVEGLFLAFHHLVIDAVSWRILAEDLARVSRGEPLPAKGSSYRQWGEGLAAYALREADQLAFWLAQGEGSQQGLLEAQRAEDGRAATSLLQLDKETTARLIDPANQAFFTRVPDLLLAALTRTLSELGYGARHCVMLEGHGREAIDAELDVSRTLGWFTSTYPLALADEQEWDALVCTTKERLRAVPDKGVGFNALRLNHPRGQELPQALVVFNYLGVSHQGSETTGTATQPWQPLSMAPGAPSSSENLPRELVSLHGGVYDGRLTLRQVGALNQSASDALMARLADNLTALVEHCCAVKVPRHTPSDFPGLGLSQGALDRVLSGREVETLLPMTSLQQSMFHHRALAPRDTAYHLQTEIDYHQPLDVTVYRQAWQAQIARWPALRSELVLADGVALQRILQSAELPFHYQDLVGDAQAEVHIAAYRQQDLARPIALDAAPLLRVACFKLAPDHHKVVFSAHHGVLDGWSGPVLLGSLHSHYQQLMKGQLPQAESDTAWLEFGRHIASQARTAEAYWQGRGALLARPNDLSCLFGVALDAGSSGRHTQQRPAVCTTALPTEVATLLAHRVRELGVTPGLLAQYAWHRLLARCCGDDITLVGNVTPGRDYPIEGITASVGLYINSLPLALEWRTELSLAEHIARLQSDLMALNEHGTQSLSALTKGRARLFQSLFVFENYPMPAAPAAPGPHQLVPRFGTVVEKVELPLSLVVNARGGQLNLRLEFDGDLIPMAKAEAVLAAWIRELEWLAQADLSQPAKPAAAVLSPAQGAATPSAVTQVAAYRAESGLVQPPAEARVLVALWQRHCGVPGVWQQSLQDLGVDSVQQLALLAALNEAFADGRGPLSLGDLKTYGSPCRLFNHWLVRQPEEVL
ncbi:amonabactin biosynthesis non-ribosomal peptide synthetase AmoG [Aeromonas rivipollensis]|uniref:amonabactin biosynthesis non-ribosomal peptide synthetase AmoG n=1 Tax=Aeromonas rivipollensis TaxID=948519 RepID=UPI001F2A52A7|nr:amonabactin biosynthesis non-ribosomal peptide synthetase AmoG [Aeromonas rivipollensis]MCE9956454.1 amonabactin biosynthesis non-ribosomal peptide synthetase AmoG [Aeromonas rivipollensis]